MGLVYTCYAEAKIDGQWHGIDLYARDEEGQLKPVPLVSGKSVIGSMIEWLGKDVPISRDELAPETREDHPWLFEHDTSWGTHVRQIPGGMLAPRHNDYPEFGAFVAKDQMYTYLGGSRLDIDDWLTPEDFRSLPEDVRSGYQWFEWTPKYGDKYWFNRLADALETRIDVYNEEHFTDTDDALTVDRCRVILFIS